MTDDQRHDDLPDDTIRAALTATGDRPAPEFVSSLRAILTDTAADRTTAAVMPLEQRSRHWRPLLAAAAVVALVVAAVAVLVTRGDGEIATVTSPTTPTDTQPTEASVDHPSTAEQLDEWVGVRLNGLGNGPVDGEYPWFVITSIDAETGGIWMTGNDGCNDWSSRGTIVDGRYIEDEGESNAEDCGPGTFAPTGNVAFIVHDDGIDIEHAGVVYSFRPEPVDEASAVLGFADLVGDQLVVVGPEYGPAVQLRIERMDGNVLTVDGIDECNGYGGDITVDDAGVVIAAEMSVNANACSGPPSSGEVRAGDVLRPTQDDLTIERDGVEFRLVSLDAIGAITDAAEIDALGEIRIGGRRTRFGAPGVVEVDGCELAWTIDDAGRLSATDGDQDDPLCAGAEPGLIAYGLQNGGITFHRSPEGVWVRSLGWRTAARVVVPPPPGTLLDTREDHVGLRFVDVEGALPGGGLPWIGLDWQTDDRVRLTLDVGCEPEQLDLLLDGDEIVEVVRDPFVDEVRCASTATPAPGDRFVLTDGVEIGRGDDVQRFVWIDAAPRLTDPLAGSFLLNGERITFQDGTVSWGDCVQPFRTLSGGVAAFPLDDEPEGCSVQEPPHRLFERRRLLFGGVTTRPAGDDVLIERHGLAALLSPDTAGAPTPFDLQGSWRLIGWIDPPQTTSVEPFFALYEQGDGYQITLFDGCSQIALQTTIEAGVITGAELTGGPASCPDADVPFEPVTFRVGDRFDVDGSTLMVIASDGSVRYVFDSVFASILTPTVEQLTGAAAAGSWRPAGSDARPLRFSVDGGTLRLEYGTCASTVIREPSFELPDWPADSACFEDPSWIERAVAQEVGRAAVGRSDPFRVVGAELQLRGERVIRLEPAP